MAEFKPITGEIVDLDTGLNELFDYKLEHPKVVVCLIPENCSDFYRTIWYDIKMDEFVDVFNTVLFTDSWIKEHKTWVMVEMI